MLRSLPAAVLLAHVLLVLPVPAVAMEQPGLIAVEMIPVDESQAGSLAEAESLHAVVAGEHGIAPLATWVAHRPDGSAVHLRLWSVPDGRSLEALRRDGRCSAEGHAAHARHGWLLTKARDVRLQRSELAWIELVVPRDGHDLRDHAELHRALAALGQRYGIRSQSSLVALSAAGGPWEGVMQVELWAVPSRAALERLHADPEWPALERRLRDAQRPHPLSGMLAEAR